MIDRRTFLAGTGAVLLGAPLAAEGQQVVKVPKIGLLQPGPRPPAWVEAFRHGLRELGHVDGQNVVIEHRLARDLDEQSALATELVRLGVDVIFTWSTPAVLAARREALPNVSRIAVAWNPANPIWPPVVKRLQDAAPMLGVTLHSIAVRSVTELEAALPIAKREGTQALVVMNEGVFNGNPKGVVEAVRKSALPTMYSNPEFVGIGGLMMYSPNFPHMFRQAASHVDKILKGANPANLPIEQPSRFELIINLKTAKALGLTIPQSLLQRADQVIE